MAKHPQILTTFWSLLFISIMTQSISARILLNPTPTHHPNYHNHHKITFLMQNTLDSTPHPPSSPTTKINGQLPFPKPLGLFPPNGAIPLPYNTNPSTQTFDLSTVGLSFPAKATLQELEFGSVKIIDENLFHGSDFGASLSSIIGKAQGVYVASSEDRYSHMMAMTILFADNMFKDGLRFFGVYRTDVSESHIAVIGGTGKYQSANGYAAIQTVHVGSNSDVWDEKKVIQILSFNVYLS